MLQSSTCVFSTKQGYQFTTASEVTAQHTMLVSEGDILVDDFNEEYIFLYKESSDANEPTLHVLNSKSRADTLPIELVVTILPASGDSLEKARNFIKSKTLHPLQYADTVAYWQHVLATTRPNVDSELALLLKVLAICKTWLEVPTKFCK